MPGLAVSYYALAAPESLPDFGALTPYSQQVMPNIDVASTGGNFAGSGRAEEVGAVWTGWLRVDQAGTHRIAIESDDGSRVWIGDRLVVNNDGLHGMVERSAPASTPSASSSSSTAAARAASCAWKAPASRSASSGPTA